MLRTKLYSPIFTPLGQLGDFGIGVGMYFSLLFSLMILTFLAGLMSIPNIAYFASDSYSESQPGLEGLLVGSAVCTDTSWVSCQRNHELCEEHYLTFYVNLDKRSYVQLVHPMISKTLIIGSKRTKQGIMH